jgi:hypothetical protein
MYKGPTFFLLLLILLLSLIPQLSLGLGLLHKIRLNFLGASQQFSFLQDRVVSPTSNPIPEDQASVFISLRGRVAQLYPWAPILVAYKCKIYEGRLKISWNYLIIPSRNFVEVRWRFLFEEPPLASDELLTMLYRLLENVLQTVCRKLQEDGRTAWLYLQKGSCEIFSVEENLCAPNSIVLMDEL